MAVTAAEWPLVIASVADGRRKMHFGLCLSNHSIFGHCIPRIKYVFVIPIMENFFGLLKQEIYYGVIYYSYEELKSEIERYIKYYNEQRIKEKLGWMSPVQYRLNPPTASRWPT